MRLVEIGLQKLEEMVEEAASLSLQVFNESIVAINEWKISEERSKIKEMVRRLRRIKEEVDELAVEIIARYQPLASELRRVKASMDLAYAFLRFGRYAYDALAAFGLLERRCEPTYFNELAKVVRNMMEEAIESLKNDDIVRAAKVISKDDEVDSLYHQYLKKVMEYKDTPCAVIEALSLKFLERAADHCVHVAEQVMYILEGKTPE